MSTEIYNFKLYPCFGYNVYELILPGVEFKIKEKSFLKCWEKEGCERASVSCHVTALS